MNQTTISIVRGFFCSKFCDGIFKILIFFLLVPALSANRAAAQEPDQAIGLSVGQALPDSLFHAELKLLGARVGTSLRLADFKGKPLILDFWASWCGSCIKSLPHVDSLLKVNGQELRIVLVNSSARDRGEGKLALFVSSFLKDHEGFSVPFVAQPELFSEYFKIRRLPCYVWVGSDGRIKAVSGYGTLNQQNVRRFLDGEQVVIGKEGM
ncbi:TlpA family protein disulfide reductase [Pedobacter endophyticus]|uniref:Redoxin family protein n=1 Tax=Pedobacter endophyticus TaxID=2789740 RepID=A0A7S9L1T7_9SPHI|nr:TlpA disulfide reductase family protein [Pedobacter endophyticus]QPH40556.1 redoxin family protein [Pedobacter endophyticus]